MTSVKKRRSSLIVGYGEVEVFEKLIERINHEFKTNPRYQRSVNSIDIRVRADTLDSVFDMIIDTRYYTFECELHVTSNENDLRTKLVEKRDSSHTIEGLIVALDHNNSTTLCPSTLIKSTNLGDLADDAALNLLVHVGAVDPSVKLKVKQEMEKKLNDEILEFELHLDNTCQVNKKLQEEREEKDRGCGEIRGEDEEDEEEEEDFSTLDELINCLFVHNWQNMDRKTDSSSASSHRKIVVAKESNENNSTETNIKEVNSNEDKKQNGTNNDSNNNTNNYNDEEDDDDDEDFSVESLIANLNGMRAKANQMSFEERKQYAEKVVTSFWKSIGGSASELAADLNNDDN